MEKSRLEGKAMGLHIVVLPTSKVCVVLAGRVHSASLWKEKSGVKGNPEVLRHV
jgi:hypothetical protein